MRILSRRDPSVSPAFTGRWLFLYVLTTVGTGIISWESVGNAESQVHPRPTESESASPLDLQVSPARVNAGQAPAPPREPFASSLGPD